MLTARAVSRSCVRLMRRFISSSTLAPDVRWGVLDDMMERSIFPQYVWSFNGFLGWSYLASLILMCVLSEFRQCTLKWTRRDSI